MNEPSTQSAPKVEIHELENSAVVKAFGEWTIHNCMGVDELLKKYEPDSQFKSMTIDLTGVCEFDTAGAWLAVRFGKRMEERGLKTEFVNPNKTISKLMESLDADISLDVMDENKPRSMVDILERIGRHAVQVAQDCKAGLNILGAFVGLFVSGILNPKKFRVHSIGTHFYNMGMGAVPIVFLISFLTGAILAQQGGYYLKLFGADIFIVDLMGVLTFREIGLLLAAIMVAGRSGSAITAEIGSMKMREEIDALKTLGLNITEVLILPRMIALIVALPILTFISDIAALSGSILVSWFYLDISPRAFLSQLQLSVNLTTVMVGLVKSPFMAATIALIAAIEGTKVKGSTDSLGYHTTYSVVKSIFMVIVVDGLFAIFFVAIGV